MTKRYRVLSQTVAAPVEQRDEAALAEHRASLYARLEIGYERIAQGLEDGQDVTSWEEFWIALLREYERVCDDLTGTCVRRDHVGAQLDARQETQGRWVEQRIGGMR